MVIKVPSSLPTRPYKKVRKVTDSDIYKKRCKECGDGVPAARKGRYKCTRCRPHSPNRKCPKRKKRRS